MLILPTRLGGSRLSALHNWREVMPGLCLINDRTEKSTGDSPYSAMRSVNSSMTCKDTRRAL